MQDTIVIEERIDWVDRDVSQQVKLCETVLWDLFEPFRSLANPSHMHCIALL